MLVHAWSVLSIRISCLDSRNLDQLLLLAAQLQVFACHLVAPSPVVGDVNLINLYADACILIELAAQLDQEQEICEYGSTNTNITWNLAACIILRVGKSHVRGSLDVRRGQKCYFSTINLNKKQSVRSDDIASRATIILSQLWTSKTVIKQPDGTPDSLWLRCRNRLGWSIVFDCFWLWRQEFDGRPNPYDALEDEKTSTRGGSAVLTSPDNDGMMGLGWSPDTVFQDFQWPIFDEFLYTDFTGGKHYLSKLGMRASSIVGGSAASYRIVRIFAHQATRRALTSALVFCPMSISLVTFPVPRLRLIPHGPWPDAIQTPPSPEFRPSCWSGSLPMSGVPL